MNDDRTDFLDGFLEFATPTDADYRSVLRSGLVVIDTNVVLNLYRYHKATRTDLLSILEALGDRLFVPYQVAMEFWRNREGTIRGSSQEADQMTELLEGNRNKSIQALSAWAERVALPESMLEALSKTLRVAYERVVNQVDGFADTSLTLDALNTNRDPVLAKLAKVLRDRVGAPLSDIECDIAREEARRRMSADEPPGFKDKSKDEGSAYGDYFIWAQLLKEAKVRAVDVLLVTGDVKEDWWRRERGETRGPRLELSAELRETAGGRLFMLRPANLLARAKDALDLSIRDESVQAAERVDRLAFDRERHRRGELTQLFPLEKLPDGKRGDYLETLVEMTALARGEPCLDEFIVSFQRAFPTITLKEVARRRMRILVSLDLVTVEGDQVRLTDNGHQLLEERSLEVVQECFTRRIAGASEIADLATTTSLRTLRRRLRLDPPEGLSSTQALLVLRYMEQLDLV